MLSEGGVANLNRGRGQNGSRYHFSVLTASTVAQVPVAICRHAQYYLPPACRPEPLRDRQHDSALSRQRSLRVPSLGNFPQSLLPLCMAVEAVGRTLTERLGLIASSVQLPRLEASKINGPLIEDAS